MRLFFLAFVVALLGCSREEYPENGVYVTAREVFPLHSEILELRNGRYQYWTQGDVGTNGPTELQGKYTRQGDRILISGTREMPFDRLLVRDHDALRLLRYDSEETWTKERRYASYGTLTRIPYTFAEMKPPRNSDEAEWNVLFGKLPVLKRSE